MDKSNTSMVMRTSNFLKPSVLHLFVNITQDLVLFFKILWKGVKINGKNISPQLTDPNASRIFNKIFLEKMRT